MRFTEKTIRTETMWAKVTRDNQKREFTLAIGYVGEVQARDIDTVPFCLLSNWTEALTHANRIINR